MQYLTNSLTWQWLGILTILLVLSDAFQLDHPCSTTRTRSRSVVPTILYSSPTSNPKKPVQHKTPMIIVGNEYAALGAALALCAMDVLRNGARNENRPYSSLVKRHSNDNLQIKSNDMIATTEDGNLLPPAQPIAFFHTNDAFPSMSQSMETFLQTSLLFGRYTRNDIINANDISSTTTSSSSTTSTSNSNSGNSHRFHDSVVSYIYPTKSEYEFIEAKMKAIQLEGTETRSYHRPILYIPMGINSSSGNSESEIHNAGLISSYSNEALQSLTDANIWDHISFLGIHVEHQHLKSSCPLTKEEAKALGSSLQTLISQKSTLRFSNKATILSNLELHLSMLQSNSLPKSLDVLEDCWVIMSDDEHDKWPNSVLVEYQYDNDRLGGSDPLSCSSKGYIFPFPNHLQLKRGSGESYNHAFAAAYCAMVGSGMDPLSSLSIATSVKAVFVQAGEEAGKRVMDELVTKGIENPTMSSEVDTSSNRIPNTPSYCWDTINQIAEYSRGLRKQIQVVDGWSRKRYRELDYK